MSWCWPKVPFHLNRLKFQAFLKKTALTQKWHNHHVVNFRVLFWPPSRAGTIPVSRYSFVSWKGNKTRSNCNFFRKTALMLETNIIMLSSRVPFIYFPSCSTHYFAYSRFLKGPKKCCDTDIVPALPHSVFVEISFKKLNCTAPRTFLDSARLTHCIIIIPMAYPETAPSPYCPESRQLWTSERGWWVVTWWVLRLTLWKAL